VHVATNNPFTPTFGSPPPLLAGRDGLIELFGEALDDGPGSAGRATLYAGARGAGKTVLLNAVEDAARARGWLVVAETATPGFLTRLADDHLPRLLAEHDPAALKRRLSGFGLPANLGSLDGADRPRDPGAAVQDTARPPAGRPERPQPYRVWSTWRGEDGALARVREHRQGCRVDRAAADRDRVGY
jgi:hypothetical protein